MAKIEELSTDNPQVALIVATHNIIAEAIRHGDKPEQELAERYISQFKRVYQELSDTVMPDRGPAGL